MPEAGTPSEEQNKGIDATEQRKSIKSSRRGKRKSSSNAENKKGGNVPSPATPTKPPANGRSNDNAEPKQFDKRQLDAMNIMVQKKKNARQQAKEEERNFVEFRKLEILYNCRPTSMGAYKSRSEDSFPRRRRGVEMGYGERKAHFLAIRPDPRYATWFGKKPLERKRLKEKATGAVAAVAAAAAAVVAVESVTPAKTPMPCNKEPQNNKDAEDDAPLQFFGKKGQNWQRPLDKNAQPFWLTVEQEEDLEDDDMIVTVDALEKALRSEIPMVSAPHKKEQFDPFAEGKEYKTDDKIFDRKVVFTNTVCSVIALATSKSEGKGQKSARESGEQVSAINWEKEMKRASYNLDITPNTPKVTDNWQFKTMPLIDIVKN